MDLRLCTQADLPAVLNLFRTSVHTLCRADYTPAQLSAWAPADTDEAPWARRLQCQTFLLAEEDGDLMGFASLEGDYLDLLYVHPRHARRGVGTVLCDALERQCTGQRITVHASLTARPFFAMALPSRQVITDAASPGRFTRIDVVEPPYMAP